MGLDLGILYWIREHLTSPFWDVVFVQITNLGEVGIFWILLTGMLYFSKRTRRLAISLTIALVFDLFLCNLTLKPMFDRVRPFVGRDIELIVPVPSESSFPSGHSAVSFAAAFTVLFHDRKWGKGAIALATVIAFSRLYLFVHYPTDVIAGCLCGFVSALFSSCFRFEEKRALRPFFSI
ncbi:MAG: phosphatase PAP2 family protein [Clostridia bacterium]|nr:phosphatase PAP2 family protein [Clostridia bacterium]